MQSIKLNAIVKRDNPFNVMVNISKIL